MLFEKKSYCLRSLLGGFAIVLLALSLYNVNVYAKSSQSSISENQQISDAHANVTSKVYVWFFGYIGNVFYPQYQLNISQQTMISLAQNLSKEFGKKNLVLLTAVDEIPPPSVGGGLINTTMIPVIRSYVSQLKQYASAVYGRLDFLQFNLTSVKKGTPVPTVYDETKLFLKQLGLNGIWFDRGSKYYSQIGSVKFNEMMQNFTTTYPHSTFILNHTPSKYGFITELPNYTWRNDTYVTPSPYENLTDNFYQIQELNSRFPGHVLLHLDADGPAPLKNLKEPMGEFAKLSYSQEIAALNDLAYNGTHPALANESYSMIYPIVGSWTFPGNPYNETLYNSLSVGNYARETLPSFEGIMLNNSESR